MCCSHFGKEYSCVGRSGAWTLNHWISCCFVNFWNRNIPYCIRLRIGSHWWSNIIHSLLSNYFQQGCIPVGCVPPACCSYLPVCTAPGGTCLGVYLSRGGVPVQGVPAQGGMYLPGGYLPRYSPLWTEFLTHATENITLPQTSFAGGKYADFTGRVSVLGYVRNICYISRPFRSRFGHQFRARAKMASCVRTLTVFFFWGDNRCSSFSRTGAWPFLGWFGVGIELCYPQFSSCICGNVCRWETI